MSTVSGQPSGVDSIKADQFNALSKKYWRKNLDTSVYYAHQAMQIAEKSNYGKGTAEAFRNIGVTNMVIGDWNVARTNLLKAMKLYKALSNSKGMAATSNNLGGLFGSASPASLAYYDTALTLFRKIGDKEGEGSVLNYIGINYQEQGNFRKAIDYCLQGYEIRKAINDHPGVVFSLINVGNMYLAAGQALRALNFYNQSVTYATDHNMAPFDYSLSQIGITHLRLKQYDKAESYLIKTVNGKKEILNHLAVGDLYSATGRLDSAIVEYEVSLKQAQQGNKQDEALALIGLAKAFITKKNYGLAKSYGEEGYRIAESLQNRLILGDAALVMATIHKSRAEYEASIRLFELAHSISDSVVNEDYQQKLAFTESKNEIENQQAQVKLLSAEKSLQEQKIKEEQLLKKLILVVFAIAVIASMLIIRNINQKRVQIQSQKDEIELQSSKVEKAYEELRSTQAQLIQREKMASLGELTAGIAHEIQNPLNFVNNFAELNSQLLDEIQLERSKAIRDLATEDAILNDIKANEQKINHHGQRVSAIVHGMLQHSRPSSGQKEETDINILANEYLRLSYQGLRVKDKSFYAAMQTDFDSTIGKTNLVPQDIGTVLLNLYNNAFYAVSKKKAQSDIVALDKAYVPKVWVSTKKIGERIEITVRDNGDGIPENLLSKIFQPFFTTKPTGHGTGLGLSLSYDIVKTHGGEISVQSVEGEFTELTVILPS